MKDSIRIQDTSPDLGRQICSNDRVDVPLVSTRESQCPAAVPSGKRSAIGPCESPLLRARACPTRRHKLRNCFATPGNLSLPARKLFLAKIAWHAMNLYFSQRFGIRCIRCELAASATPCSELLFKILLRISHNLYSYEGLKGRKQ